MKEMLEKIGRLCEAGEEMDTSQVAEILSDFLKTHVKGLNVKNYIGDFPTFIEPLYLGARVKIGDDVLLGPNVYIGSNCEIGDYVEISNSIILDDVKIGENFKLDNCIVAKNSSFNFSNFKASNCILNGQVTSIEDLKKIYF